MCVGTLIGPDDLRVRTFQDADDRALAFALGLFPADGRRYAGHDLVTVHGVELAPHGDEDVRLPFFLGDQEPEARRMRLEDAGLEVHFVRQPVAVAARLDDLAALHELVQRVLEIVTVFGLELQQAHELARHDGLAGPGPDDLEKLFVGVVHK